MTTHLLPIFSPLPVSFVRGEGRWLIDSEGKRYLDGFAGIAVNTVGHAHPVLTAALRDQVDKLIHCSNYFQIDLQEEVAALICQKSGLRGCFFCNSGLEANEAAIKLARKYGHSLGFAAPKVVVFEHSFHGRSIAALSATGGAGIRRDFHPYVEDFLFVPCGDVAAIERLAESQPGICAVMFETVQGEGGIYPVPEETIRRIRQLCDQRGWLMIVDEVQTGMGRTGRWFGFQHADVKPNAITMAKALGGGVPVGALVCDEKTYGVFAPGNHGSTFGGNPLAMRAARTVFQIMEDEGLVENAARVGARLIESLRRTCSGYECFDSLRGRGLMIGLVLNRPAHDCLKIGLRHGVLFSVTAGNVIRVVPSLNMTLEEADELARRIGLVLADFCRPDAAAAA